MNYFVSDKKIMARQSIAEPLEKLSKHFLQIQKSYIVNFSKINALNTDFVIIGDHKIHIGSQYKNVLKDKLK